jgi:hypothetical protein
MQLAKVDHTLPLNDGSPVSSLIGFWEVYRCLSKAVPKALAAEGDIDNYIENY